MGAFYANITIKGASQKQIVDFLTTENRDAWATPTVNDVAVVYDSELTRGCDANVLVPLTKTFSQALDCVALGVSLYDSDIFRYALYQSGQRVDRYHSAPGYWYDGSENLPPEGGNAFNLCAAFGIVSAVPPVEAYLPDINPSLFREYDNRAERADLRMKLALSSLPVVFLVHEILHSGSDDNLYV